MILDASFSKRIFREIALHEAQALDVPYYFIQTKATQKTIRERLIERGRKGESISDGRWDIFEKFKEGFEEPNELPQDKHLVVSTNKTLEEVLIQTLREIIIKRLYKNTRSNPVGPT